jgi:hypothetical protein
MRALGEPSTEIDTGAFWHPSSADTVPCPNGGRHTDLPRAMRFRAHHSARAVLPDGGAGAQSREHRKREISLAPKLGDPGAGTHEQAAQLFELSGQS